MKDDDLAVVRAACIAAHSSDIRWNVMLADEEKVRLADVLRAIAHKELPMSYYVSAGGFFYRDGGNKIVPVGGRWNLRADDLSQQSPEMLKFLADLLRV